MWCATYCRGGGKTKSKSAGDPSLPGRVGADLGSLTLERKGAKALSGSRHSRKETIQHSRFVIKAVW